MSEPKPVVQVAIQFTVSKNYDVSGYLVEDLEKLLVEKREQGLTPAYFTVEEEAYSEGSFDLILTCRRPETGEECAAREKHMRDLAASQLDFERRQYESLKKKFEGSK